MLFNRAVKRGSVALSMLGMVYASGAQAADYAITSLNSSVSFFVSSGDSPDQRDGAIDAGRCCVCRCC